MSALPLKADMFSVEIDVCFVPRPDMLTSEAGEDAAVTLAPVTWRSENSELVDLHRRRPAQHFTRRHRTSCRIGARTRRAGRWMTLYRSKTGTVDAFRYQSGLETMDFKYPYPDWLERHVVVRGEFGLDLCTKFGKVTVRPGQWIVNAGKGKIHVLDPDVFHAEYAAVKDA